MIPDRLPSASNFIFLGISLVIVAVRNVKTVWKCSFDLSRVGSVAVPALAAAAAAIGVVLVAAAVAVLLSPVAVAVVMVVVPVPAP